VNDSQKANIVSTYEHSITAYIKDNHKYIRLNLQTSIEFLISIKKDFLTNEAFQNNLLSFFLENEIQYFTLIMNNKEKQRSSTYIHTSFDFEIIKKELESFNSNTKDSRNLYIRVPYHLSFKTLEDNNFNQYTMCKHVLDFYRKVSKGIYYYSEIEKNSEKIQELLNIKNEWQL
jgi:hypothetical protein